MIIENFYLGDDRKPMQPHYKKSSNEKNTIATVKQALALTVI